KSELPNDLTQDPEVLEINLSELPVMTVNLSGNYSNDELKSYAEYLEDEIEDLSEISKVDLKGALEREVQIDVDLPRMESLQVNFGDIENAIRSENVTMSAGELLNNDFRRTIRVLGEFQKVEDLENLIVKSENQRPIYLRDIAEVTFGYKETTSIARADLFPVISLDVIKASGENLLDASDKIKAVVDNAQATVFPKDLSISIFNDQSVQTRAMVTNLENSIISGVILVVVVLLFFLGIRNAMFVGIAIPLSMLMGIMIINILGYTLNMVLLFSLILALGMLVDNAIVVVENVYRYRQNGYSGKEAAKYGTGEVALPIIASTATTLAAFLPLAFWPGLMGSFMKYLPITLIIVLSSSLFVALVINPVLTSAFLKVDERAEDKAVRVRKRRNVLIFSLGMIVGAVASHFAGVMWARNLLGIATIITLLNFFVLRGASFYFQNRVLP
ncbi:MAG: efflux RND transporter permease subunit, partial [Bacteroidota bacterium]